MLLLAIGSYRFVEKPLRRAEWSRQLWKSIGYGLVASFVCAALVIGLESPLKNRLYVGNTERSQSQLLKSSWIEEQGARASALSDQIRNCNMTPHYLTGEGYRPRPNVDAEFIARCTHSSSVNSLGKVVLVGDSYAGASAHHIALAASSLGYEFKLTYGFKCPYPLRPFHIRSSESALCADVDGDLLYNEIINALMPGDLLVFRLDLAGYLSYHSFPPVDAYDDEILALYSQIIKKGARLLVVGANPLLRTETFTSGQAQWFQLGGGETFTTADTPETVYFLAQDRHLTEILPRVPGLDYFSTANYLCGSNNVCYLRKGDRLLYSDVSHISPYAHDLFFQGLFDYMAVILHRDSG
jgi:hypothetical protein